MTSREVIDYIENIGIQKLYKKFEIYFKKVDTWSEIFATGDLLDEYQLSKALDELTGVYCRFNIIAGAIDAYKTNKELNFKVTEFKACSGKPNVSQINELARESTKELRTYRADFLNYAESAEKGIGTCQSRLKRLTVEKGAREVDFTGETPCKHDNITSPDKVSWEIKEN